jgi:hypothetical protein
VSRRNVAGINSGGGRTPETAAAVRAVDGDLSSSAAVLDTARGVPIRKRGDFRGWRVADGRAPSHFEKSSDTGMSGHESLVR